ncbi:MAG TPA: carboxypeptidase regulatory-like domain-containing protein [Gemmatimonadaceae bacterium]
MQARSRAVILLVAVAMLAPRMVLAQSGTLSGVVRTEDGAPIQNALVVLDPEGERRTADTDEQGRFRFDRVAVGEHDLRVVRLGYRPDDRRVRVETGGLEITIVLQRLPTALDTLRVVARETGVFGMVVEQETFNPIANAAVTVMRTSARARTGPNGQFTLFGLEPGSYVVWASASGRLPTTISVVVPKDSAVELLLSLIPLSAPGARRLAQPLADFEVRTRTASRTSSALVPRQEVVAHGNNLGLALRYAPSFLRAGLRFDEAACLYVNGEPRPGLTVYDIDPNEVAMVELYAPRAFLSRERLREWPRGIPCGSPGARVFPGGDRVSAIVVWLKP